MEIFISSSLKDYVCFSGKMKIHKNEIEICPINKIERTLDSQIFELKNTLEVAPVLGEPEKFKIK